MISLTQLGQPLRLTRFPPVLCQRGYVRPFDREAKFLFVGSTELNAGFHSGKVNRVLLVVRQFVVLDMKRISFCSAQALRFGITG